LMVSPSEIVSLCEGALFPPCPPAAPRVGMKIERSTMAINEDASRIEAIPPKEKEYQYVSKVSARVDLEVICGLFRRSARSLEGDIQGEDFTRLRRGQIFGVYVSEVLRIPLQIT